MTLLRGFIGVPEREPIVIRQNVTVDVVQDLNELVAVFSVRSRVFQNEQFCPYEEEFDGNDLAGATHLLARLNEQPVGTMRLRWFADFAKSERFAVTRDARATAVAFALIDAACLLAGRKGYKRILGHAQKRVAPFWTRRGGGEVREDRPSFSFSGHEYVEVIREIEQPNSYLTIDSPPLELDRPEGDWDREGVLDLSSLRAA